MNTANGAVVPPNLVPERFLHFTCDNIDINDSSLDGMNSFHATQVAAWQHGPSLDMGLQNLKPVKKRYHTGKCRYRLFTFFKLRNLTFANRKIYAIPDLDHPAL